MSNRPLRIVCPNCGRPSHLWGGHSCDNCDRDNNGHNDREEPVGVGPARASSPLLFGREEKGFVLLTANAPVFTGVANRPQKGFEMLPGGEHRVLVERWILENPPREELRLRVLKVLHRRFMASQRAREATA